MSDEQGKDGMKEAREAADRANERAAKAEAALRGLQAEVLFEKQGLHANHAELFLKANPEADVTPDAVQKFAETYNLQPQEAAPAPEPKSQEPPADSGLAALSGAGQAAGSGAAPAPQAKLSMEDFETLLRDNPQAAVEAYAKGLAPRNPNNVQADKLVKEGVIDH